MKNRKLLIGLATAGTFSAGLGANLLPASAQQRTLLVTLLGGQTVTVTVDVPPGTPLDQVKIPGVSAAIVSIQDVTPQPQPTDPAPTTPATEGEQPAATPAPDPEAPVATTQDRQETTGKKKRAERKEQSAPAGQQVDEAKDEDSSGRDRPKEEDADDEAAEEAPSPGDPGFSLSLPGPAPIGVPNFFIDKFRIPPFLLPIYQAAGIQYGVRWEVLAAINEIETDYGRNLNVSTAGALGWMQFMPATWKAYGVDANQDGRKDPYNPVDAIFAAARYLKAAGFAQDVRKAVFAYNHADWYVDSVLLRARLIGGLPADLVGSLTGLTQGHFPVFAKATYTGGIDTAKAATRVKGRNAAIPVESRSGRRGIDVFAKAGSPVVAVQDGKVTRIGTTTRLGRFIQIQDVYGNTYTYGHLKKISQRYLVPKEQAVEKAAKEQDEQPALGEERDPKPTAAASAGTQRRKAKAPAAPRPEVEAPEVQAPGKQRLFASPSRPAAYAAGGDQQLFERGTDGRSLDSYFSQRFGLKRSDVELKPLRQGSRVIAGTVLGRIGTTSARKAPHVRFEIRPAGKDAPRIDPKPILDGWKLLESTEIYRAAGKNPFFGPDAKNPSIGQILLMSKEALQRRVLEDPRVELYAGGDRDIRSGAIDRRVLATLAFLSSSGLRPTVTSLKGNHSYLTKGGNVSAHASGNAVDIGAINGIRITPATQGEGSITDLTIRRLLTLQGTMKPNQIISLMTYAGTDNTLSLPDHGDHIHVGFQPLYGSNSQAARQLSAVLKPGQWSRLIDRLGKITNPIVPLTPSKYAITVKKPGAKQPGD
jgi:hypothetical protein